MPLGTGAYVDGGYLFDGDGSYVGYVGTLPSGTNLDAYAQAIRDQNLGITIGDPSMVLPGGLAVDSNGKLPVDIYGGAGNDIPDPLQPPPNNPYGVDGTPGYGNLPPGAAGAGGFGSFPSGDGTNPVYTSNSGGIPQSGGSQPDGGAIVDPRKGTMPLSTGTFGGGLLTGLGGGNAANWLQGILGAGLTGLGAGTASSGGGGSLGSRNYAQEGAQTLATQIGLAPDIFSSYGAYGPAITSGMLGNFGALAGGISPLSSGVNTANRTANLQDAQNLSGGYASLMRGANPEFYGQLGNTMGLQNQQNDLASHLLGAGGSLTPEELRNVQQSSRAAFNSRGLGATNASIGDEIMQTDAARRQRLLENLGMAQSIQGQNLSTLAGARSAYLDPFSATIGGTDNSILGNILSQGSGVQNQLAGMFDPFNQYAQDLYNTNYNANAASSINGQNNRAALGGGLMSIGGSLLGGLF